MKVDVRRVWQNKWWLVRSVIALIALGAMYSVEIVIGWFQKSGQWMYWKWHNSEMIEGLALWIRDWMGEIK